MERTTVEAKALQLQTIQGARVILGVGAGKGRETPSTRYCINIDAVMMKNGEPDQEVPLQVWITPSQLAAIVKQFFTELILEKPFYSQSLRRMLRKRWAFMTSGLYKTDEFGGEWVKPYDDPRNF